MDAVEESHMQVVVEENQSGQQESSEIKAAGMTGKWNVKKCGMMSLLCTVIAAVWGVLAIPTIFYNIFQVCYYSMHDVVLY